MYQCHSTFLPQTKIYWFSNEFSIHRTTIYFFFWNLFKGADMDVCLTKYGHCNYISGKHACIFYDEVWDLKSPIALTYKYDWFCTVPAVGHDVNVFCMLLLEHQTLWAAQLQWARHHGGQRPLLLWFLREGISISTQWPCGQSPRHHPWVYFILHTSYLKLFAVSSALISLYEATFPVPAEGFNRAFYHTDARTQADFEDGSRAVTIHQI